MQTTRFEGKAECTWAGTERRSVKGKKKSHSAERLLVLLMILIRNAYYLRQGWSAKVTNAFEMSTITTPRPAYQEYTLPKQ